jgi:ribonuclease BN (tRNA processing enzyme)
MARIVALGTASMVNDAEHDYTHLLLIGEEDSPILIDVGENPLGKIKDLGLQDEALQDIILTHFQSNMVGGLPNMFMHMWLQGRTASVRIYGLMHCLERIRSMLSFHGWETLAQFLPRWFFGVREEAGAPVIDNADFTIHAFRWHISHPPLAYASSTSIRGVLWRIRRKQHPMRMYFGWHMMPIFSFMNPQATMQVLTIWATVLPNKQVVLPPKPMLSHST